MKIVLTLQANVIKNEIGFVNHLHHFPHASGGELDANSGFGALRTNPLGIFTVFAVDVYLNRLAVVPHLLKSLRWNQHT